jgi:hypothetical protein
VSLDPAILALGCCELDHILALGGCELDHIAHLSSMSHWRTHQGEEPGLKRLEGNESSSAFAYYSSIS